MKNLRLEENEKSSTLEMKDCIENYVIVPNNKMELFSDIFEKSQLKKTEILLNENINNIIPIKTESLLNDNIPKKIETSTDDNIPKKIETLTDDNMSKKIETNINNNIFKNLSKINDNIETILFRINRLSKENEILNINMSKMQENNIKIISQMELKHKNEIDKLQIQHENYINKLNNLYDNVFNDLQKKYMEKNINDINNKLNMFGDDITKFKMILIEKIEKYLTENQKKNDITMLENTKILNIIKNNTSDKLSCIGNILTDKIINLQKKFTNRYEKELGDEIDKLKKEANNLFNYFKSTVFIVDSNTSTKKTSDIFSSSAMQKIRNDTLRSLLVMFKTKINENKFCFSGNELLSLIECMDSTDNKKMKRLISELKNNIGTLIEPLTIYDISKFNDISNKILQIANDCLI